MLTVSTLNVMQQHLLNNELCAESIDKFASVCYCIRIMSKKCVLAFYLLTVLSQTQREVTAAPYDIEDHNAIIVIPFKSSEKQISKIVSYKIDGETAIKQLSSRVSAEKILRTLSNVPEFSILAEGLDAITLGDVYKAAFPNGILYTISEQYLRSPTLEGSNVVNIKPATLEGTKSTEIASGNELDDKGVESENEIQYDEVLEDDTQNNNEDLKEEPITDDYVYDQPIEDRFVGDREYATKQNDEIENEDKRDSKNMNYTSNVGVVEEGLRNKELSKYGERFRNWMTNFLAG